jgi:hypothetical protein
VAASPHASSEVLLQLIAGRESSSAVSESDLPKTAAFHGLSAFVLHRAREGPLSLSPTTLQDLEDDAVRARRLRSMLDLELSRIANSAPANTATAIVLKGPAVARHWPQPSIRPYVDIDLLVPEGDLEVWGEALEGLGYAGPTAGDARAARLGHHHLVYTRGGLPVELHWRLFTAREAAALDHAALSEHAAPDADLGGLLAASLPAQLVILGVHLAHHRPATRKLVWLLDFILLGTPDAIASARRLADVWRVRWALEAALADAEAVLGEPRWEASPQSIRGLARARRSGAGRWRTAMAKVRALGIADASRYGAERVRSWRRAKGR